MTVNLAQDHASIAWENWPAQFSSSTRLAAMVKSLVVPMNSIQTALAGLYDNRWLDTASGAQLDGIGEIVGQPRQISNVAAMQFFGFADQQDSGGFGEARMYVTGMALTYGTSTLGDDDYRLALAWKIRANNSRGTVGDIVGAVTSLFEASALSVEETGDAAITVHIARTNESNVFLKNPLKWIPSAAGIAVRYELYDAGEAFTFG